MPCVPGSEGLIKDEADCLKVVEEIGLPVMIKATAGERHAHRDCEKIETKKQANKQTNTHSPRECSGTCTMVGRHAGVPQPCCHEKSTALLRVT